ncbi:ISL3 family transposase [Clostridium sp. DJ247]|uniref:ISL3 family transposase n=1 Tax=Clostridium sp. DJ247 TaxID=2726188 RepID=UPI00162AEF4B|nr:ISL3 family transposase [Clostridium sp. DJ247]MBC2580404.1 ISL3 family transposase [Clostridium sp. DJ247]
MPLDFNFIENLIGLQDIKVTFLNVNNDIVEIYAESKNNSAVCPKCNKVTHKIHDYRIQSYDHLPICNKTTIIRLKICRYMCECDLDHPFDEVFSFIRKYQPHTIPFEEFIFKLTCKNTIKNVAELLGFSDNKVQRIFNHYAKIKIATKEKTPLVFLGIDDITKSKGYIYYTVIYNHETGDVVSLIDGRTKEDVVKYITENFTKEQRESVLAVSLDMSKTYASAVLECFPNAAPVTDRFYISQALHVAVDEARKHIQNKIRKEDSDKKKVFGIRWAFLKNHEDLKVEEEKLLEPVCM